MRKALKEQVRSLLRDNAGITGLETAIVLIAFVVVSSVFAFAALSTGLFSSDQAKETIQAGLGEAQGTLDIQGDVIANATLTAVVTEAVGSGDGVDTTWPLANGPVVRGSQTVYLAGVAQTEGTDYSITYDADPSVITFVTAPGSTVAITADYTHYSVDSVVMQVANAAGGKAVDLTPGETLLSYQDADNLASAIDTFGLAWLGTNDSDNLLEEGEKAQLTVTVSSYTLHAGKDFSVQVKPQQGAVVSVSRTMPSNISALMTLN